MMKVIYMHKTLYKKLNKDIAKIIPELPPDWKIIVIRSRKMKRKKIYIVDTDKLKISIMGEIMLGKRFPLNIVAS